MPPFTNRVGRPSRDQIQVGTTLPLTPQVRYGMGSSVRSRSLWNRLGCRPQVLSKLHQVLAECPDHHRNGHQPDIPGAGRPHYPRRHGLRGLDRHRGRRNGDPGHRPVFRTGDGMASRLPATDPWRCRRPQVFRIVVGSDSAPRCFNRNPHLLIVDKTCWTFDQKAGASDRPATRQTRVRARLEWSSRILSQKVRAFGGMAGVLPRRTRRARSWMLIGAWIAKSSSKVSGSSDPLFFMSFLRALRVLRGDPFDNSGVVWEPMVDRLQRALTSVFRDEHNELHCCSASAVRYWTWPLGRQMSQPSLDVVSPTIIPRRRPWNYVRVAYSLGCCYVLIALLFGAYTLSYGIWIWIAVKYNISDKYAWIQDDFYGPLHWLSAQSEWYGRLTAALFWWGYGSD